MTGVIRVGEYF